MSASMVAFALASHLAGPSLTHALSLMETLEVDCVALQV